VIEVKKLIKFKMFFPYKYCLKKYQLITISTFQIIVTSNSIARRKRTYSQHLNILSFQCSSEANTTFTVSKGHL